MVAQVVVDVGYQHVEDDAPPQLPQVPPGPGAVAAQRVGDLQVRMRLAFASAEHAHGREERDAATRAAVEAPDDQHVPARDGLQPPLRHLDAALRGERERDRLPEHDVHVVVGVRELRNGETAVRVANGDLRACPAQGGARAEKKPEVFIAFRVPGEAIRAGEQARQLHERRNAGVAGLGEERTGGVGGEPKRPLAGFVVDQQQDVRLGEGPRRAALLSGAAAFRPPHQETAPVVGHRIADGAEQRPARRGVKGTGREHEGGLEGEALGMSEPPRVVLERRAVPAPASPAPQTSDEDGRPVQVEGNEDLPVHQTCAAGFLGRLARMRFGSASAARSSPTASRLASARSPTPASRPSTNSTVA